MGNTYFNINSFISAHIWLGKGPKIKKARKYGLWPYIADPPPNLNCGLFIQIFGRDFFNIPMG